MATQTPFYLKQLGLGPMSNCVYAIGAHDSDTCVVIDPAWEVQKLISEVEKDGRKIVGCLVTHYHPDHCGGHLWGHDIEGVAEVCKALDVPIYANKLEIDGIAKVTGVSLSQFKEMVSGEIYKLAGIDICPIHTPGHTPGSQCFLCADHLLSGDTLFVSGCGRVDLPGGDVDQMWDSIHNKLAPLPDHTVLLPGHHYDPQWSATFAEVRRLNPYLAANDADEFKGRRL